MEKFKIYFTVNGIEDFFIIEDENFLYVSKLIGKEMVKRNLKWKINKMWSEAI